MMSEGKQYVSTADVAEHLSVSASWLAKLRMRGEGPAYFKLGGRCVLYDIDDVETWVKAHRREASHV